MQHRIRIPLSATVVVFGLLLVVLAEDTPQPDRSKVAETGESATSGDKSVLTEEEARGRARLLHETFHATLQFVHQEYYREGERLPLPAATLERVFGELARRRNVKLRWLAVNAKAMNVDHNPHDDFEKAAVAALTAGKEELERVENDVYRHAGVITLTSDCLKCHLPGRTSNRDRVAALAISIPLKTKK